MVDNEAMAVKAGCIAQETTDSEAVWTQIGANWAISRTLYEAFKAQA